ncbi:MAG: hypothetical protein KIT16_02260 [Rhodospirillaceae bacterium]|nr:hypothetical protein [Rhodospirillaceae bacterium]
MRWILTFAAICVAAVAAVLGSLWLAGGADELELGLHGYIALALGIVFTAGVGIGLMALVFYSNRSGRDEAAHGDGHDPQPRRGGDSGGQRGV